MISFSDEEHPVKIFISHSQSDARFAEQLGRALQDLGLEPWLPEWHVLPGDNGAGVTAEALEQSDVMVALVSPSSMTSRSVKNEIMYAIGESRFENRLVPVLLGNESDLPAEEVPWVLRRFSWVRAAETNLPEIARRIARVAHQLPVSVPAAASV